MLISGLRALRAAQQSAPITAAAALSHVWRCLATESGSGGGGGGGGGGSGTSEDAGGTEAAAAEHTIAIDRSGLITPPLHSRDPAGAAAAAARKEPETELARHLKTLIEFRGGPLSLAEFMSEALTNPQHGYYTQREVFGTAGDFVTSPEISQMMGEMVGIWCVAAWQQLGCPPQLHLVEMGPGKGTLMADLLRGTAAFQGFSQALRVSLVEVSPRLRRTQWQALRCSAGDDGSGQASSGSEGSGGGGEGDTPAEGVSGWNGARVSWHRSLDEVEPQGPALYLAHEFLDALPVHQFQRTDRGWCERLVDVATPDSPLHLRLVLSPGATPAARALLPRRLRQLPPEGAGSLSALEVCPQAMALAESLARRVEQHGGAALIIDYGQDGPYESSLQAIRRHAFVPLLQSPGTADISNRVDYSALRASVEESGVAADCLGPIPQAAFLLGLGVEQRLQQLLAGATPEQAAALQAGYRRLVGESEPGAALTEEGMGTTYQAFCIAQRGLQPWPFGAVEVHEDAGGEGELGEGTQAAASEAGPQAQQQAAERRSGPPSTSA